MFEVYEKERKKYETERHLPSVILDFAKGERQKIDAMSKGRETD